ncbi:MAG: response regulator transcription factor [Clostridiales Family XIII bacterium]|jgi:DNA-binding response OmpR family regulator|nr:response regulator transcription factor [Clostridiales Family XIII bacterium]
MDSYTILVCDDEEDIVSALRIYLEGEGYGVLCASDGAQAVELLRGNKVHLVILDVMMPVMDGVTAALKMRAFSNVPIIFLSAKGEEADRVLGLHAGADDYIVKPFTPMELFARVKSQIRRYSELGGITAGEASGAAARDGVYRTGGLVLDDARKQVTVDGDPVPLTALEYNILKLLISNLDCVYSSSQIYESVWNEPAYDVGRTVAVHIRHIREKIEADPRSPRYLKLAYGLGYKVVTV